MYLPFGDQATSCGPLPIPISSVATTDPFLLSNIVRGWLSTASRFPSGDHTAVDASGPKPVGMLVTTTLLAGSHTCNVSSFPIAIYFPSGDQVTLRIWDPISCIATVRSGVFGVGVGVLLPLSKSVLRCGNVS